jgi:hypothetical protein
VLTRTTSGVTISGTLLHYVQDDLPFGGIGASGFGAYHGIEEFRAFSHQKAVLDEGRWNGGALLRPPFGRLTNSILSFMLRQAGTTSGPPIEVRNAAVIHASIERVWDLLTDVERWPSWWRGAETQVGLLPWLGRAFLAPRLHAVNQAMFDDLNRAVGH